MAETIENLKTRAAELRRSAHFSNERIDALNDAAWQLRHADLSLTAELSALALERTVRNDYERGRAFALRTVGWCQYLTDHYKEAEQAFEKSCQAFRHLKDDAGLASAMNGLGAAKLQTGDYEAALEAHSVALSLREKISDSLGIAGVLLNIGTINSRLGEYAQALDYYYRVLQTAVDCGSLLFQAHAYGNLGNVLWRVGEAAEAVACSEEALSVLKSQPEQRCESMVLSNLAAAQHSRGEHKRALDNYQRTLQTAWVAFNIEVQVDAKIGMGSIYRETNDLVPALTHLSKALQLSQQIGNRFYESYALLALGTTYRQAGELRESLELLERALEISQELSLKEIRYKAHRALSHSFEQAGETTAALFHHQNFHRYHQEINGINSVRQIQRLLLSHNQSNRDAGVSRSRGPRLCRRPGVDLNGKQITTSGERAGGMPLRKLKQVTEFINHHLEHHLTLAELAAVAGLGQRQFQDLFKAATGKTPHQFILEQRITRAQALLQSSNLPLSEVALSCGFSSQSHLSTQFRLLTGRTPLQFRRSR